MEVCAGVQVQPGELRETNQHGVGEDVGGQAGARFPAGDRQAAERTWGEARIRLVKLCCFAKIIRIIYLHLNGQITRAFSCSFSVIFC